MDSNTANVLTTAIMAFAAAYCISQWLKSDLRPVPKNTKKHIPDREPDENFFSQNA